MSIPRHIFKQYDIRGLVGTEITEDLAEAIGRAYAQFLRSELPTGSDMTVVVGRDMRESSVVYQARLMAGLVASGVRVLDIGLVSTPAFYFGVGHLKADGGIMV
ncbi:phosphomannomutase CpsG, partial [Candidatus Uhrbacteria bacterium]|nr:phosphomannomutase CpsG [Candidatus Uhrbacteria bacterium]